MTVPWASAMAGRRKASATARIGRADRLTVCAVFRRGLMSIIVMVRETGVKAIRAGSRLCDSIQTWRRDSCLGAAREKAGGRKISWPSFGCGGADGRGQAFDF